MEHRASWAVDSGYGCGVTFVSSPTSCAENLCSRRFFEFGFLVGSLHDNSFQLPSSFSSTINMFSKNELKMMFPPKAMALVATNAR